MRREVSGQPGFAVFAAVPGRLDYDKRFVIRDSFKRAKDGVYFFLETTTPSPSRRTRRRRLSGLRTLLNFQARGPSRPYTRVLSPTPHPPTRDNPRSCAFCGVELRMWFVSRVRRCNFLYEILAGLYMLDPWERVVFNSLLIVAISVAALFLWPYKITASLAVGS